MIFFEKESLLQKSLIVIPAKAGIQDLHGFLNLGFRRGDDFSEFCKRLKEEQTFAELD